MGVTGLWTVVKPCARPIKLETLNRKRLAVDASIWIYQFLKAVRDKEGNALRNSHVVGFFRRICKLLYFGIKPVFVFDGVAPALKRETIAARKRRREGRREDAARTAGKLLAVQMRRIAEEEDYKRRETNVPQETAGVEEELPEQLPYVEEQFMTPKEKQQSRHFRKKDAYHLPDLEISFEQMGAPNDPRIMSHEELEEYAKQFHSGEAINLYDFSKIDFDSPFFLTLPASDRYNILNAARIRSRLRMGYSKDQLDTMFPDRMAFSKFQVERVARRNDLTQRLMNLNGMNEQGNPLYGIATSSRIASDRGREYVLVKDNTVEGGWALGVLGSRKDEGKRSKPIDVDQVGRPDLSEEENAESSDEDAVFEDVPIEGQNRLPKLPTLARGLFEDALDQNETEVWESGQDTLDPLQHSATAHGQDSRVAPYADDGLFVADGSVHGSGNVNLALFRGGVTDEEDLQRAIQMSLENPEDDDFIIGGISVPEVKDRPSTSPRPKRNDTTLESISDPDDENMDLLSALAKSKAKRTQADTGTQSHRFDGPLPFETLKVKKSVETDRKSTDVEPDDAENGEGSTISRKRTRPPALPPWFAGDSQTKDFLRQEPEDPYSGRDRYNVSQQQRISSLREAGTVEVIDVEECESQPAPSQVIETDTPLDQAQAQETDAPQTQADAAADPTGGDEHAEETLDVGNMPAIIQTDATINSVAPETIQETEYWVAAPVEEEASILSADLTAVETRSPTPEFEDVDLPPGRITSEAWPMTPEAPSRQLAEGKVATYDVPDFYAGGEVDYSDPEDADLLHDLAVEAEEHARFATTLNSKSLAENARDYEHELKQLRSQQQKDRRDADEVTQIMITECQQLLSLFGLPYITAPMEAEAQCAELVSLGLVDGIVTDDSDVFLFGGTRIYKNMFNQAKFVECYLTGDLEKEYALDRRKLVRFAHLLGSDYTEGIPGIGPVTALEILTEFGTLEEFRDWWTLVQRGVKLADDKHSAFRKRFKKNLTKLFLPASFPDNRVDKAYLEPEVDPDPTTFQWGVPDLEALRRFLMETIGWSRERTDEVLVPVILDMNRREQEGTQANITRYFDGPQGAGAFAPRSRADGMSRMGKAFSRLRQEAAKTKRTDARSSSPSAEPEILDDNLGQVEDSGDRQPVVSGNARRKRAKKMPIEGQASHTSRKKRDTATAD